MEKNKTIIETSVIFGEREHRSTLKSSLETKRILTKQEFNEKLKYYEFYGYDERCKQFLFILKDMPKNYKKPVWLYLEIKYLEWII